VLRKDLAAVSSHGHFEGGLKEASTQGEFLCRPRITGHCYFWRMGYDLHEQQKKRETCSMV
jgi:hypothetical protein